MCEEQQEASGHHGHGLIPIITKMTTSFSISTTQEGQNALFIIF